MEIEARRMMHIARVTVEGTSEAGAFRGTLELGPGVQVISSPNRFGKSIAFSAVVWCLGVEHIFGVQASDNAIFPDAPRNLIDLGDVRETKVIESSAEIELVREDGCRLKLRRAIVGERGRIAVSDGGDLQGNLVVGYGTMADPTAGFQTTFRKWAGLPEAHLMTSRGNDAPIYFENLAPLFLVTQLTGWADIQAEQVYRYGLQEIVEGAFEYLLGLDATLAARLLHQRHDATAVALKEEARVIAADFALLFNAEGWIGDLGTSGNPRELAAKWQRLDLGDWVKERYGFDGPTQLARLGKRAETLRTRLTKGKIDAESTVETTAASTAVVGLKEQRHELQLRLGTLRSQLRGQERLLRSVEDRFKSARDLARFKKEGIGILPKAECPTCHQTVDPAHLELTEQSVLTIELYIEQLDHQRHLLRHNVDRMRVDVAEAMARADRLEDEFVQAEHGLRLVNQAVGPAREVIVKAHNDLLAVERELDRVKAIQRGLDAIQDRIKQWIGRAEECTSEVPKSETEVALKAAFVEELRALVLALGCAGVNDEEASAITLDERYTPMLRGRWLRSFGSASDRARLIVAYLLALAASGRHHPGFVVLDEPLQQNPDQHHRRLFIDFLLRRGPAIQRQAVVFTCLPAEEVAALCRAGVSTRMMEGRFLRLVEPVVATEEAPSGPTGDPPMQDPPLPGSPGNS